MKRVIGKICVNYEKEENWLNKMAEQGKALAAYSWCRYIFEDSAPGEHIYRIELLENLPSHPESRDYLRCMKENGVECVAAYL